MVDAISSINLATKTYFQKKKDEDIAWERLTPSQIIQYMNDGEDVPEEIMRWAEEVSRLEDAPDDVTYEMVNGSTNLEEINEVLAISDSANANDKDETDSAVHGLAFHSRRCTFKGYKRLQSVHGQCRQGFHSAFRRNEVDNPPCGSSRGQFRHSVP